MRFSSSSVRDTWDTERRCYNLGCGRMEIDGSLYDWGVSTMDVGQCPRMPTSERVVVKVAPNLSKPTDAQVVVNMGFGESTAMAEKDFLTALMQDLRRKGFGNPAYIGINPSGKGTLRYATGEGVGKIRVADEIDDVRNIVSRLCQQGLLSNVHVVGHSMGALGSFVVASVAKEMGVRILSILNFAPVTDEPFGLIRGGFLWVCRRHVVPAIRGLVTNAGMSFSDADYSRMMFANDCDSAMYLNYERGLPDSGRRFLEITLLNMARRFDEVLADLADDGTGVTIIEHGRESIVPPGMPNKHFEYMRKMGVNAHLREWVSVPHAIPFRMTAQQKNELDGLFNEAIPLKR